MAERHVVINEAPPTDDDAGVAGSGYGLSVGTVGRRNGQTLPLNSRRLTVPLLRQLAEGLGVPTTASQDDLRSMIEGRLMEADCDPLRTQVVLREVGQGTHISLQDESGVFQEIEPLDPGETLHPSLSESEEEESEPWHHLEPRLPSSRQSWRNRRSRPGTFGGQTVTSWQKRMARWRRRMRRFPDSEMKSLDSTAGGRGPRVVGGLRCRRERAACRGQLHCRREMAECRGRTPLPEGEGRVSWADSTAGGRGPRTVGGLRCRRERWCPTRGGRPPTNQQVLSSEDHQPQLSSEPRDQDPPPPAGTTLVTAANPQQYLLPDTDEEDTGVGVKEVRVQDKGSQPQSVCVVVDGVVDTAADITIVGIQAHRSSCKAQEAGPQASRQDTSYL